jgi:hypothetical protein
MISESHPEAGLSFIETIVAIVLLLLMTGALAMAALPFQRANNSIAEKAESVSRMRNDDLLLQKTLLSIQPAYFSAGGFDETGRFLIPLDGGLFKIYMDEDLILEGESIRRIAAEDFDIIEKEGRVYGLRVSYSDDFQQEYLFASSFYKTDSIDLELYESDE